ncbi:MAG TPA: hypothetical protein VJ464_15995 [Blastocatellia bacterium]|nr:hypothetical protein [Blastocatellia bacterium]
MGRGWWSARKSRAEAEAEMARLAINLKALPTEILRLLSAGQINKCFDTYLSHETILQCKKKILKAKEGQAVAGKGMQQPIAEDVKAQVVLDRIAAIITKGYAHLGDNEKVGAEDVQMMIYRELKTYDLSLLTRNEKKRLPKQSPAKT